MSAMTDALWELVPSIARATSFQEMFAGSGGVSRELCASRNLLGHSFDACHFQCQDATSLVGMLYAAYVAATIM
eukprot:4053608-Pyramimonas_sp.AAC.1